MALCNWAGGVGHSIRAGKNQLGQDYGRVLDSQGSFAKNRGVGTPGGNS